MPKEITLTYIGEWEGANRWAFIPRAEFDEESKQIIIK